MPVFSFIVFVPFPFPFLSFLPSFLLFSLFSLFLSLHPSLAFPSLPFPSSFLPSFSLISSLFPLSLLYRVPSSLHTIWTFIKCLKEYNTVRVQVTCRFVHFVRSS
ncbi:MAG: hypothetical protein BYD32DRAFT_288409 [Podila humilis]|nr:MAG: hypothetical protein BYD32DRAFT_288409 [Podila humilis]